MTTKILTITIFSAFILISCKEKSNQENVAKPNFEKISDDMVSVSSTDKNGKKLDLLFNNSKGTLTLQFNGETIELTQQLSGSGIRYKNEQYELRGKGNDIELKKDGIVLFEHKDEIVSSSIKNKDGQTLDITFNNTTNLAKVYLNGGEQIELAGQNPASGIWYKNEQYELRGKGENLELKKDGKIVFKSEK